MSAWPKAVAFTLAVAALLAAGTASALDHYGLGRPATPEEIAGWDIDVRPDGAGLPEGSGSALDGEGLYLERCSSCHGEFGEAFGRYPALMGGDDSLDKEFPVKTIGSYWPYASTIWDYVHRAMPFGDAESLSADQTYALVAYLLYLNDLADQDFVLSRDNFTEIVMPNQDGFVERDGPDLPKREPCMKRCKQSVQVIGRARVIDVTPENEPVVTE